MAAPPSPSPGAKRGGLSSGERWLVAAILAAGVALAGGLMIFAPLWAVSEQDYRCPPAAPTASSEVNASCLGTAGADGIDDQALSQARVAARTSFGVLSAGLLAGAAAAIGVVVSNHNAALTRDALNATVEANKITKDRDQATSTREGHRDRDTAERERERAADERFTTAIGQLGHPSASVRLGGMHSLHRLALGDGERLPTIVDVLCAYLRQPFHHPAHDWDSSQHPPGAPTPTRAWWPASQKERDERDSEREVRSTATRLIPTLLPPAAPPQNDDAPRPLEINLSGAMLDALDFSGRRTGSLRLDGAHIDGSLTLGEDAHIHGALWLGLAAHIRQNLILGHGARIHGALWLGDAAHIGGNVTLNTGVCIRDDLWLGHGARIGGDVTLNTGARVRGALWLDDSARIHGDVRLGTGARIDGDLLLDTGAHIDSNLILGEGAHIDGNLVTAETAALGGVRLHRKAAMDRAWFQGRDVTIW